MNQSIMKFLFFIFINNNKTTFLNVLFPSESVEINDNEHSSKLPRHISRHYTSNASQYNKKIVTPIETSSNHHHEPINRRKMKQFRNEFIRKWADDARNTCAQNHIIHSPKTYSDEMTSVDLEKNDQRRQKSTHHRRSFSSSSSSSSSSLLNELHNNKTKVQSSGSTVLSSVMEDQSNNKHKNTSSNNSAVVYLQSKKPNDNIDCKIS
jgi:hypothetical protein